jgi:hypothetical protein
MTRQMTLRASFSLSSINSQSVRAGLCALLLAAAAALAPQAVFAQHGGGGGAHGGGGFGGGGFGGGHASGGGFGGGHSAPAPSHAPAPHPASTPHPAPTAQPIHTFVPPPGSSTGTGVATGSSNAAHPVIRPPQNSVIGFPPSNAIHWAPPASGTGTAAGFATRGQGTGTQTGLRNGAPLSFSGQGHDIWQNTPRSGSASGTSNTMNGNPLTARPFATMQPRGNPPGRIIYPYPPVYPYYPGYFYPGFGYGLGYGYGYGFGYGGFGLGFFGCDPFSGWGCNSFGAFNYYSPYYGFGAPPSPGPSSDYYGVDTPASPPSEFTVPYTYEPPPGPQTPPDTQSQNNPPVDKDEVMVYFKDGRVYMVRDYWVAGNQLHYRTADGGENTVDWNDIDVQKTVDVNASRGVDFTLRPSNDPPADAAPAQGSAPSVAPNAPTNPPDSPAPGSPKI